MKVSPLICRLFSLILAAPLHGCHKAPPDLPSHPASEMFPRASSPPPTCPGQYRMVLEDAKGGYFMGCWGRKTD
jgi:hypothetical protein